MNVYIVLMTGGRRVAVVARSADDAAVAVGDWVARTADVDRANVDTSGYDVGRIGPYEPGISGDRLALQSWPVIAY